MGSMLRKSAGVCDTFPKSTRKSLILSGEMSEWLKEHAWKAMRWSDVETYRSTFSAAASTT